MASPRNTEKSTDVQEVMSEKELAKALGGEIVTTKKTPATVFSTSELGGVASFEDAIALVTGQFGDLKVAHEDTDLSDGFAVADEDDKRSLIGVPMILLDWSFRESDFGHSAEWVMIHAVERLADGAVKKWIISDGGTGIARELKEYTVKTGRMGGLFVANGLRESKYYIDNHKGSETIGQALSKAQVREYMTNKKDVAEASTFYLDTSA